MTTTIMVYSVTCPRCYERSPEAASTELVERWLMDHVRAEHPGQVEAAQAALVAGACVAPPNIGHVYTDEATDRATATCAACGDWRWAPAECEGEHYSVSDWLREHWLREHSRR